MTLPAKVGIGVATLSSISAVSYVGKSYFSNSNYDSSKVIDEQPQKIATSKLIEEKFEYILLDSKTEGVNADDKHWTEIWTAYKRDNANNDVDPLNLKGWNKSKPSDLTAELKKKCSDLSKEQILKDNKTHYQKVTKYCARNVTIADHIKKDKLTAIDTSNAEGLWKTRESGKSAIEKYFTTLEITPTSENNVTAENIKNGCKTTIEKSKKESNYDAIYSAYKEVCVKKNGEQ
ncbi:hypothetical protein A6V39_01360 [Candidatus Mycoplasma haematobovis]|uniref:Uncharacterized protein n=1 Tax=Candidatus Mycoplasma haematobovis TaxID=432608 RepID=A0A1A9QDM2_9MOLU|nr:hypothetical protein [Candidatus Mycoplasma haematobovis]OAL10702.1 hypothetical protein A6V39_01360 [Candidatus Mycoplasma haematobovis]